MRHVEAPEKERPVSGLSGDVEPESVDRSSDEWSVPEDEEGLRPERDFWDEVDDAYARRKDEDAERFFDEQRRAS